MKKYLLFTVVFAATYLILQIGSGIVLTMFYTPGDPWGSSLSAPSQIQFGSIELIHTIIIGVISLGISLGTVKLVNKVKQ